MPAGSRYSLEGVPEESPVRRRPQRRPAITNHTGAGRARTRGSLDLSGGKGSHFSRTSGRRRRPDPRSLFNHWGGGINNDVGPVTLANSIIADQSEGQDCNSWAVTSQGYDLDSDGTCQLSAAGDISTGIADLLPLALNAPGTTATHALGPTSQALDAIPPGANGCGTDITTDQRGVARPQGVGCDIGAYEKAASSNDAITVARRSSPTSSGPRRSRQVTEGWPPRRSSNAQ